MGKHSRANNNKHFSIKDIIRSYEWLANSRYGYTELVAFHRDYRPGREHFDTNLKMKLFPKVWYTRKPEAAVKFVKRFYQEHMCCYGVNPRPKILRTKSGAFRRSRDNDIELVTSLYLDIDFGTEPSDEQIAELGLFLVRTVPYFEDLGIAQPTKAFSGRGYHLLFAVPAISVKAYPNIGQRLTQFRRNVTEAFRKELSELELKIDNTSSLSRLLKMGGTRKPTALRISRFYGEARHEDRALQEYLLSMPLDERHRPIELHMPEGLPEKFRRLLQQDKLTRKLWNGEGKTTGDTTPSGYDFSLVKHCLKKGISDINDLAAILAFRRKQGTGMDKKSEHYIRTTIANAIKQ